MSPSFTHGGSQLEILTPASSLLPRLLKAQPLPLDSIDDETFHDAVEDIDEAIHQPAKGMDAPLAKAITKASESMASAVDDDADAGEEGDQFLDPEALKARRKERKKEKKAMKKAAKAETSIGAETPIEVSPPISMPEKSVAAEGGGEHDDITDEVVAEGAGETAAKSKKKKKKKPGAQSGKEAEPKDVEPNEAAAGSVPVPEPPRSPPPREVKGTTPSTPPTPSAASAPQRLSIAQTAGGGGRKAISVDIATDFTSVAGAEGSIGVSKLGAEMAPGGAAAAFNLLGPHIKVCWSLSMFLCYL